MSTSSNDNPSGYDPGVMGRRFFKAESLNDLFAVTENLIELSGSDCKDANLVASLRDDGTHAPAFDLDRRAFLIPTTTSGNHHMYIDEVLSWRQYRALLRGFYKSGLLDPSVYWRSLYRGSTHVRPPWVRKTEKEYALGSIDLPPDRVKARRALRRIKVRVVCLIIVWRLREIL